MSLHGQRIGGFISTALAAALLLYIAGRHVFAVIQLGHASFEHWTRTALFFLLAAAVSTGPGLFLLPRLKIDWRNPFLPPVFIVSASLGATMLATWALYFLGLFTKPAALCLATGFAGLGLAGLKNIIGRWRSLEADFRITPCEFIALALSLFFCEGMFECVAGTPLTAWDAVISWDKWAQDIATRPGLGGYVCGAYPQGLPLVIGFFYKALLPADAVISTSVEHLLVSGFLQVFPLLLCFSLIATARQLGSNPLWSVGLALGSSCVIQAAVKFVGYADIPLAASVTSAIAVLVAIRQPQPHAITLAALVAVLFPVCFTKGNGVALLGAALILFLLFARKDNRLALAAAALAFAFSAIFFLHQWTTGVWTNLGETSPFNHSLVVVASHSDLVNPSPASLAQAVFQCCALYGFRSAPFALAIAIIGASALLLPLFWRKTCLFALLVDSMAALWFFTGSYDGRNSIFVIALAAILVPFFASEACKDHPGRHAALAFASLLLCAYSICQTRLPEIAATTFRRYATPKFTALPPRQRTDSLIKATPEASAFLFSSPAAQRAKHILCYSPAYRLLNGKGVYPFQKNAYNELSPHDMALAFEAGGQKLFIPKAPFVPVSGLNGCRNAGSALYLFKPNLAAVNYDVRDQDGQRFLAIERDASVPSCGFISITFNGPAAGASLSLLGESQFAQSLFTPYACGDTLRLMYWVDEDAVSLEFVLKPGNGASIVKTEIGF